ncbi:conserved hypothetical protein [Desulfamplus magnetovallimortis]|uniref:Uncharacterized protein n=1 Tax=Desulfamplus magnetovallimortis TaxID=1246637 RepID=A0A1W1H998_9BACT|nr:hypothetical protein [Desulfamplus magnetovallimortis]SLM29057.1 conserved hypothetical protein [Desulfamplus magnetovallimortis]
MAIENDIVLVYLEDTPVFFARVESIWPDVKRDWFNIELLVLQIPLKVVVWTLKDLYINGGEFFMGGKRMRIEVVESPEDDFDEEEEEKPKVSRNSNGFYEISAKKKNTVEKHSIMEPSEIEESESLSALDEEKLHTDGDAEKSRIVSFNEFLKKKNQE